MTNTEYEDWELEIYREIAEDIKKHFKSHEINVLIKIYRWTKSEHNRYFFSHICKREPNYKSALKFLRSNALIQLVRSKGPHKISKDGIRAGRIMLLCKDLGLL